MQELKLEKSLKMTCIEMGEFERELIFERRSTRGGFHGLSEWSWRTRGAEMVLQKWKDEDCFGWRFTHIPSGTTESGLVHGKKGCAGFETALYEMIDAFMMKAMNKEHLRYRLEMSESGFYRWTWEWSTLKQKKQPLGKGSWMSREDAVHKLMKTLLGCESY